MKKVYNQKEVSRLIGISESQIRYWDKIGLIPHVERKRGLLFFDFKGLVSFRTIKELLSKGVSLRSIRKSMEKFKRIFSDTGQSLRESCISIHGSQIIMGKDSLKFTSDGQLLIDFNIDAVPPIPLPVDLTEGFFFQALEFEQKGDLHKARIKYEAVLSQRPDYVDALVNIGNIEHRMGHKKTAEQYYRKALRINPDHVEANYNLANVLEEKDDLENAVLFYKKAIHEDPEFADAHFNLARVLESQGEKEEAREHWLYYLRLDPNSKWAEHVKTLLGL